MMINKLKNKRLFPKRVNSKPPLSPRRSSLLSDALKSRFHLDCDSPDLQEAFNAVNQLASDVSRGKRLKKSKFY